MWKNKKWIRLKCERIKNESVLEYERIWNELTDKTAECEGIRNESALKCDRIKNESVLEYERIRNEFRDKTAECEWIRNESALKCERIKNESA